MIVDYTRKALGLERNCMSQHISLAGEAPSIVLFKKRQCFVEG